MDELLVPVLVLAIVAAVAWFGTRSTAVFVVRVRGGSPEAIQGKVTAAFLATVADVCREFAVTSGQVWGVARGDRISLRFSTHFSFAACQRLRNWWAMSGWYVPARRPPRSRDR